MVEFSELCLFSQMSSTDEHFTRSPSNNMTVIQPQLESVQPQTSQPSGTAFPPTEDSSTGITKVNASKKGVEYLRSGHILNGLKIMTLSFRLLSIICIVMLLIICLTLMGLPL